MLDTLPHLTLALALATLLAASAAHKLAARGQWPVIVRRYQLLPEALVTPAAVLLPLADAAALAINLGRGRSTIDCGCFGPQRRQGIAAWMVDRNLVLAAMALLLLLPTDGRTLGA